MSEIITYRLDEIADVIDCEHKTAPKVDSSDYYSIRTPDIKNGRLLYEQANRVSAETYELWTKRGIPEAGDIILAREAPVGEVGWIDKDHKICLGQRTVLIKIHSIEIDKKYLLYSFVSPKFKDYLNELSGGSVVAHLNMKDIRALEFSFPPLPEQKAIASVLSSLDDKIDLLHRQNKTLEAMAETLFRQQFIEEAKEDWDVSPLGDVVKIAYGKNLPTSRLLDSGYPVFGGNGQIGFYDRFLYSEPQVLVSCRGEASGKVNISLPNSFITNNSLILERKENGISFEYLKFYALAYDFGLHVSGSAQPQITIDGLFNAEFRWPPLGLVESFTEVVRPLEDKRLTNYIQIQILEKLRDTLLPKLMSGEVRVQYQTEEVA